MKTSGQHRSNRLQESLGRMCIFRVDQPQPVVEEKFKTTREQSNPAHHGVPKGRAERDHEHPDARAGHLAHRAFVFHAEEKVHQASQSAQHQNILIQNNSEPHNQA